MAGRKPTRKASTLSDAQRELERAEEEIRRREQELKARLKKLPEEARKRRLQKLSATTVAYGELHHRRSVRDSGQPVRGGLRKHRHSAKLQFLFLLMVLLLMLVLLWRVMPS